MSVKRALVIDPSDNVATALEEILAGDEMAISLSGRTLTIRATEAIPFGFKTAVEDIPRGGMIRKFGETIGKATIPIARGAMVHIHNLEGTRARGDLEGTGKG